MQVGKRSVFRLIPHRRNHKTNNELEMNYRKKCLIINYDVEAIVNNEYGEEVESDKEG